MTKKRRADGRMEIKRKMPDGSVRHFLGKTAAECERKYRDALVNFEAQKRASALFEPVAVAWWANYQTRIKAGTWKSYESHYKRCLAAFSGRQMKEITPGMVDNFGERLKDEGELVFDGEDCPDIIPVFAIACALRKGITRLTGLSRLKIKECDRLEAVFTQLSAIGADVKREGDDLIFNGVNAFRGGVKVSAFNDHRIAMTLAIAATRCVEPITIDDFSCIAKSYPDFLDVYVELGGKVK